MAQTESQPPWTDEQWARVNQAVLEEANRARVAATFLPLYGPLAPDADFVRKETIEAPAAAPGAAATMLSIEDRDVIQLATLQVKVKLRAAQVADPDMTSALQAFRRAANIVARLEDAIVFRGQSGKDRGPPEGAPPRVWEVHGGGPYPGLRLRAPEFPKNAAGASLVEAVSKAIGKLEHDGHFGPFTVVLGQQVFLLAQTPTGGALISPQDSIIPLLGGGSLLRSSTLEDRGGFVVALGGAPVELVVARDLSVDFLQTTPDPALLFRVSEKIALRIKEEGAVAQLQPPAAAGAEGGS
ncbi:MAG TPA: family 1 encapsulin nanocompartment shell protein [Roseiarcus sp.]|nr:family 1 encapsulin nanocompartment shell protein [Roseiarcus sp.]